MVPIVEMFPVTRNDLLGTTLSAGDWWVRCRGAEGSGHLQGCRRFRSGAGVKGDWWVTCRGLQGGSS